MSVETEVINLIKDLLGLEQLAPDAKFGDLDVDSLDAVEIVMAMEDHFKIEITDEEAQSITSISAMGTKNLVRVDPFSEPVPNTSYFYPLALRLVESEKKAFLEYFNTEFKADVGGRPLYSPMGDCKSFFPQTVKQTNDFLKPLGIEVRNFTVFTGGADTEGKNIHVDGTKLADGTTDVILEARLSYYEMAEAPGIIRWFPKTAEYIKFVKDEPGKVQAIHWLLPWIDDLNNGRLTWENCPDHEFATSSNAPSAILRTNLPHHVIQGPGVRLTVSAQLVWSSTRSPVGVWDHIENNFHLLGV
jgi:acyl carrier protein